MARTNKLRWDLGWSVERRETFIRDVESNVHGARSYEEQQPEVRSLGFYSDSYEKSLGFFQNHIY